MQTRILRKAAVALAVGGALGAGTVAGIGVASAVSDPSPSSSPSAAAPSTPGQGAGKTTPNGDHHGRRGFPAQHGLLGQRIEHGEVTLKGKDGKAVVWDVQRGSVTAVSATSVTVKSEDGFTATYAVNARTRVRLAGAKKAIGEVKTGATIGVAGTRSGGTITALMINSK